MLLQIRPILWPEGIILLVFWVSCSPPLPPPSQMEQETADVVLESLSRIEMDKFLNVFNELSDWSYTRYDHLENRSAHKYESSIHLVRIDSSGSPIILTGSDSSVVTDLSSIVEATMPSEEAPYLTDRFKGNFSYRMRKDSIYWSHPVHEIVIQGRSGSDQDVLTASYIYDTVSNQLVSARFHEYNHTILFEQISRYHLQLRPMGAKWVPYRLSMHVTLKLPFGQQQIFARNVIFYNYNARSTG